MRSPFLPSLLFGVLAAAFLCVCSVPSAETPSPGERALFGKYSSIKAELSKNQFGIPLYLQSREESHRRHADIYGIFDYPFGEIAKLLQAPAVWCDIAPLDLNIKACTYRKAGDQWRLTLFVGRKYYESPRDVHELDLSFHAEAASADYLYVALAAGKGPFFSKDCHIRIEAAPLSATRTFVHFSFGYQYGLMADFAVKSYFATIGREKVGFSVVDVDAKGNPVYVKGVRGAVERNAVRYYLALKAYLDTRHAPESERFAKRTARWYDLTARYPRQLYELARDEYLAEKRREHEHQIALQRMIESTGQFSGYSAFSPAGKR